MIARLGEQVGFINYGNGLNARTIADEYRRRGFVVVWRDRHATIHKRNGGKVK